MKESIRKYAGLAVCLFALYLGVHYWGMVTGIVKLFLSASAPLILGGVIAYVTDLLMAFYEKKLFSRAKNKKIARPVCILLALASVVCILIILVRMILPELWASIQLLVSEVPGLVQRAILWLEETYGIDWAALDTLQSKLETLDWQSIAKNLLGSLGGALGTAVTVVGSMAGMIVDFVIALVFAVYILLSKESIGRVTRRMMDVYLPEKLENRLLYAARTFDKCFSRFIVGQCIEAVILGGLCIAGMLLLRIPYATMVGTLIGFTALIPVAGAYIGGVVGVLLIATVSPIKAAVFVVFLVILQQLEGNLIYPRVVGSSIGLPGILVLAAITVGGGVLGVLGMLIGVPIAAAIYQMLSDDMDRRQGKQPPKSPQPAPKAPAPKKKKK